MPYFVVKKEPVAKQISFEDLFSGADISLLATKDTKDTVTYEVEHISEKMLKKTNFKAMFESVKSFVEKYKDFIEAEDKHQFYRTFKIPKHSGGLRTINAPTEEFKVALNELKDILETKFFFTYHTSAFAYVKGRCTLDAVRRHRSNESRWFWKTDLKSFFPSSTPEYVFKMLYKTYPLSEYIHADDEYLGYKDTFEKALSICFLDGGLPQGTPTSPMITNQIMIPIDHDIMKMCREFSPRLCVTRYADDIQISSKYSFLWSEVQINIERILKKFEAPYTINKDKTHYGSSAGRNWILGVMYNKDGNITVGHEKKKVAKASVFQFMKNFTEGTPWNLEDTQHLQGVLSYYNMVEPSFVDKLCKDYSKKFNLDVKRCIKEIISG